MSCSSPAQEKELEDFLLNIILIRDIRSLASAGGIRSNGIFVIPHPKDKHPKLVPMLGEDIDLLRL